ncbi:MAG: biotin--[acetyl-CoA-carboxylase] ligase [Burkholderiaceae bacterium]|jgi:BirA family biotin operon repressor/biotin-[acetyl-CoA-carboxylase] ligase|nr:biotin--[acetyl-CoA-carboxylase] ligase [Burkholderiaceae bacterium]
MTAPLRWPLEAVWEAVAPLLPGFTAELLPSVDSTNTELMRRARAGRCDPVLLVAEQQTAGRGRQGRAWHSQAGDSLTFSLGLPLAPADWSGLSLAVGVSVAESLQPTLPPPGSALPRIGLKWPNDLWLGGVRGDRKLGGILVETASFVAPQSAPGAPAAPGRYVVVGVGLNVRAHDGAGMSLPPGGLQEVDAQLDAPTALLRIVAPLVGMLQSFAAYGFAPMQPRFALRDVLQGRSVQLSDGRSGTAHGVGEDGALLVHTAGGMLPVTSSEISVRPVAATMP